MLKGLAQCDFQRSLPDSVFKIRVYDGTMTTKQCSATVISMCRQPAIIRRSTGGALTTSKWSIGLSQNKKHDDQQLEFVIIWINSSTNIYNEINLHKLLSFNQWCNKSLYQIRFSSMSFAKSCNELQNRSIDHETHKTSIRPWHNSLVWPRESVLLNHLFPFIITLFFKHTWYFSYHTRLRQISMQFSFINTCPLLLLSWNLVVILTKQNIGECKCVTPSQPVK